MKIIVDCFGGDNCPKAAVEGAVLAINEKKDLTVALVGKKEDIEANLAPLSYDKDRVEIIDAQDVITNDDSPVIAIRRKKESSMVVALKTLADVDAYDGMVSAGNTGALLTGGTLIVKRLNNVTRACLAPIVPTAVDKKYTIVCDAGANVDCDPSMLKEFAIMGDVYVKTLFDIEKPTVALLNNGAEEEKGNALTKETYQILKNSSLNFVGNVESTDFVSGNVDVIVCDGFAGNVAIKSTEGMAKNFMRMLKSAILGGGLRAKLGYLLLKPALKSVKSKMSTDEVGGAVLLGLKKVIIKAHGSSKELPFKAAILQVCKLAENNICEKIEKGLNA